MRTRILLALGAVAVLGACAQQEKASEVETGVYGAPALGTVADSGQQNQNQERSETSTQNENENQKRQGGA